MEKCLKCKYLDTSDLPNLFCKLTCQMVNVTEFTYCPKDVKSVVAYVEQLENQIKALQEKVNIN